MSEAERIRDRLGRAVREAWVAWAREQADPKPTWLVPYHELPEADQEADRRIGEAIYTLAIEDLKRPLVHLYKSGTIPLYRQPGKYFAGFSIPGEERTILSVAGWRNAALEGGFRIMLHVLREDAENAAKRDKASEP